MMATSGPMNWPTAASSQREHPVPIVTDLHGDIVGKCEMLVACSQFFRTDLTVSSSGFQSD